MRSGWVPVATGLTVSASGPVTGVLVLSGRRAEMAGPLAEPLVAVGVLLGWSFAGVGAYAWRRRTDSRVGALLVAVGAAWFASGLWLSDVAPAHTVGVALNGLYYAVLAHMLLAFPSGRLQGGTDRSVVLAAYAVAVGLQLAAMPFLDTAAVLGCDCPDNLLLVRRDDRLAEGLLAAGQVLGFALAATVAVLLARRWRAATAARRRALTPVLGSGALVLVLAGGTFAVETVSPRVAGGLLLASLLALAAVPYVYLAGLARTRFFAAGAAGALVARLADGPGRGRVRDALAAALGDPSVAVAYWLPERAGYVDETGRPVDLPGGSQVKDPERGAGRAVVQVERGGRRVGAIVHDAVLAEEPELVRRVAAAAFLALENERLEAELRARVQELEASRIQVLAAGDAERRRLERDLHDGAQQRLVALRLKLGLARAQLDGTPAGRLVDGARADLDAALAELRELARGLHPSVLATRGLATALRSLAARSPVPVRVLDVVDQPLPEAIETAVYFLVAECLTNTAKHARATSAEVRATHLDGRLVVEVADDGRGGADPRGSGLRGLSARVAALDGHLTVHGRGGGGTVVRAEIPLPASAPPEDPPL